ncbi:MAG: hypothetical protein A3F92_13350 [Candidatus Rokubacteria bacterium RIFCSPLOWO2_12_FULL_71_22]|nr:MAG: hypothetical protein A3F92_13350 [Candidatus Rokubacteria bacterium RIFCSPLOWO2_12_FULL_71_22]
MKGKPSQCLEIEPTLAATATGDGDAAAAARVEVHVAVCAPCRAAFARYRDLGRAVAAWGRVPEAPPDAARARLESRLADLRKRTLLYRVFPSPLGDLLIARSEAGVSLVEYLAGGDAGRSRLLRTAGVEAIEDGADVEVLYRELMEYLEHKRTRLEWPLDLRLARSDFHRRVLAATAEIPYGAVMSYAGIACEIGKPAAVRAVAQALRWNPLPIVVPCHRVVGTSGALTGYAGDRVGLKQRLLAVEGVPAVRSRDDFRIPRDAMYVRTPGSTEYCLPSCAWLERIEHPHRVVRFASRASAEAAGLTPCTDCRPDLHPLAR